MYAATWPAAGFDRHEPLSAPIRETDDMKQGLTMFCSYRLSADFALPENPPRPYRNDELGEKAEKRGFIDAVSYLGN